MNYLFNDCFGGIYLENFVPILWTIFGIYALLLILKRFDYYFEKIISHKFYLCTNYGLIVLAIFLLFVFRVPCSDVSLINFFNFNYLLNGFLSKENVFDSSLTINSLYVIFNIAVIINFRLPTLIFTDFNCILCEFKIIIKKINSLFTFIKDKIIQLFFNDIYILNCSYNC